MAETLQDIIDKLPSGDELIKRAIQQVRRHKPLYASRRNRPLELWCRVSKLTGNGSGYSTAICVKYGFDPSETWIQEAPAPAAVVR